MIRRSLFLTVVIVTAAAVSTSAAASSPDSTGSAGTVEHGDKGFVLRTDDGRFAVEIQARGQFRYATPWDSNPASLADLERDTRHDFTLNRARLKIGGHAYRKELTYFWEYELANRNLLDFRVMLRLSESVNLKVGQWKVQFNRERAISSGKQQMSDRSIVTPPFTVDRQQGVSLFGRLSGGGTADFSYWLSVFSGTGQQMRGNDDDQPMWMGRLQWNPFGRVPKAMGSDLQYTQDPAALVAFGAVTNQSPYTTFSQDGGGQLPGFDAGASGQYRVNQWVEETGFVMRGLAWQQELHWKEVKDRVNDTRRELLGNFFQAGYFFHHIWSAVPPNLELAARHAFYDPDRSVENDLQRELSVALNWFIRGHLNKVTAEIARFEIEEPPGAKDSAVRFRLQWDVSL